MREDYMDLSDAELESVVAGKSAGGRTNAALGRSNIRAVARQSVGPGAGGIAAAFSAPAASGGCAGGRCGVKSNSTWGS